MNTTKQIKKYIAFYPASSQADQYWTADSIKEITRTIRYDMMISGSIKKRREGMYSFGSIEIYNTIIIPDIIKEFEN